MDFKLYFFSGWGCSVFLRSEAELEFQSGPSFLPIRHSGIGCDYLATPTVSGLPGLLPTPSRVSKILTQSILLTNNNCNKYQLNRIRQIWEFVRSCLNILWTAILTQLRRKLLSRRPCKRLQQVRDILGVSRSVRFESHILICSVTAYHIFKCRTGPPSRRK